MHGCFHIVKYLNEGVDKVHCTEHRELQQDGDVRLKGGRQVLLFNPESLSEEKSDKLGALRKNSLAAGRAWGLKELFRFFWQEIDAVGGRALCIMVRVGNPERVRSQQQGRNHAEEPR